MPSSGKHSTADLILKGHSDLAEFALGCSTEEPLVASGGKDTIVRGGGRRVLCCAVPDVLCCVHLQPARSAAAFTPTAHPPAPTHSFHALPFWAQVLVWNLGDQVTSLCDASQPGGGRLLPQHRLQGHTSTVEDVTFRPGSASELASVGEF